MLNLMGKSKIVTSRELPVTPGQSIKAEGLALVQVMLNGEETVQPSTGAAGEKFVGFSYSETFTPITKSNVEAFTAPAAAPYTLTLAHAPVAGQILVKDTTAGVALTAGDPAAVDTEFSIAGNVITVASTRASHSFSVTYRFAPTVQDLLFNDHIRIQSFNATDMVSSIGVIQKGEIFTDQFDASVDWSAATSVKLAAGGVITDQSGSGAEIPGAVVIGLPTGDSAFVGIRVL